MRNPFDQYEQPENRLTHALLTCLSRDDRALRRFTSWTSAGTCPKGRLEVLEQSMPGTLTEVSEDEAERRGLPDGWITDGNGWGVLIESKYAAKVDLDQLRRHLRTAARCGLDNLKLLLLTVGRVTRRLPSNVIARKWSEIYQWLLRQCRDSVWGQIAAEYLEVSEARGVEREYFEEGTLTVFTGINFGVKNPYSYLQAKRLQGLLRDELLKDRRLQRRLGADPKSQGRGAITGRSAQGVWDFVGLKSAKRSKVFTQHPHLTLGVRDSRLEVFVTVPNGVASEVRRSILGESFEDFSHLMGKITAGLSATLRKFPGAIPMIVVVQRRYPTQRSAAIIDAIVRFDPRTAFTAGRRTQEGSAKRQPQWLQAVYELLKNRRSNLQFQIGADFPYDACEWVATRDVTEAAAQVCLACESLLRAAAE
jgi:hypothetical protein